MLDLVVSLFVCLFVLGWSVLVCLVIFERFPSGLVFVLQLNMILGFQYQASTRLRSQNLMICLENESRVGTPIRRNLKQTYLLRAHMTLFYNSNTLFLGFLHIHLLNCDTFYTVNKKYVNFSTHA